MADSLANIQMFSDEEVEDRATAKLVNFVFVYSCPLFVSLHI
jgi:hypothetical protein